MLRISSKCRYAVRIMAYLAQQSGSAVPARKQDIADSEEISADYVEQILIRLRSAGLVASHRGARGGFTLARDPHQIRVLDVVEAAEGPLAFVSEDDLASRHPGIAVSSRLWCAAQDSLEKELAAVTILELAGEVEKMRSGSQLMYDI